MKRCKLLSQMKSTFAIVALLISAQSQGQIKKGDFFITPMYQLSYFNELKLVSHTNYYTEPDGEFSYSYNDNDIQEYNDNYGTEYYSSMVGIRAGYEVLTGLGVSVYAGVNHFYFKSWISTENTQTFNADYPALSLGAAVDYTKVFFNHWKVMALTSCTYTITGSGQVSSTTGSNVVSTGLSSLYWDIDLAAGYQIDKFLPYAGVGFTQQFVHPVTTEENILQNENGFEFLETTKFDSQYRGDAFYGFGGLEFSLTPKLVVYAQSSFPNPFRINTGIKITI